MIVFGFSHTKLTYIVTYNQMWLLVHSDAFLFCRII
jgi:hypothetical protein